MNSVASLLSANDVLLDPDVADTTTLLVAVGALLEQRHGLAAEAVAASLNQREQLGSTGLGQGVAIPHARLDGLNKPVVAFVRLAAPIEFNAPDGKPVGYFFVLLAPLEATKKHLELLSVIAEMFASKTFLSQLAAAKTPQQLYLSFANWQHHAA